MEGGCAGPQSPGGVAWSGTGGQDPGQLDMLEKAHEFFQTCDVEGKGFITRHDMQVKQSWLSKMMQCKIPRLLKELIR